MTPQFTPTLEGRRPFFTFSVGRRPPSHGDFTRRFKSERLGYRTIKRSWWKEVPPPSYDMRATGPRTVCFTRILGKGEREYDGGNFVGGMKPILDILVQRKWLVDDRGSQCMDYYFQKDPLERWSPMLVIELYEGLIIQEGRPGVNSYGSEPDV